MEEIIAPGSHLHHVFKVASTAPLEISVVNRQDISAEAVLDQEGWCVIILTNVVGVPVEISEEEPLIMVMVPVGRKSQADHWKAEWIAKRSPAEVRYRAMLEGDQSAAEAGHPKRPQ